ncbi:aminotransferase class IV [Pseudobacteroides cellulosolvens]|uniref:aminotransferase class IV n=1 Tax=Pseudobacteroides cellulosolvens TaxID=35825 RepID=UPI001364CE95|nr:aminotransferase class IV [Pseudobacteroides cellulosolvens]
MVETIKLKDGKFYNLDLHNKRFNNTREALFKIKEHIDLMDYLKIHRFDKSGLFKCRIVYSQDIHNIEFVPYAIRPVKFLKLVYASIDYSYKYENRKDINSLFTLRENCDDILIVKDDDRLTDTSAANIAFFDNDRWYTPSYPLLKGVKREMLLQSKTIFEEDLKVWDLKKFNKAAIFSTMVDFGEIIISVSNIYY